MNFIAVNVHIVRQKRVILNKSLLSILQGFLNLAYFLSVTDQFDANPNPINFDQIKQASVFAFENEMKRDHR